MFVVEVEGPHEPFSMCITKNRSIGPELMTAKTGPIHLSSLVEIAFVD